MRYAMLICGDEAEWEKSTAEVRQQSMQDTYAWFEKWGGAGKVAEGGVELQERSTAKTIRGSSVTDGPFIETKETVGGVVLLECDSMDEALEIAATWPGLAYDSVCVEVRPTVDHAG